jgi:4-amino-4-deoxy-L-arabinose transferase-like glycosyltransferase
VDDHIKLFKQKIILSPGRLIFVIMGLAFVLRISATFILQYPEDTANAWSTVKDIVENIVAGKGFTADGVNPDFFIFPVYPIFVAALRLCHLPLYFVKIVQCIIAALTCLIIYHICKRAFNDKIGICAAFLWAIYPYSVTHTQALEDSTLMVMFSTLGILASLVFVSKKTYLTAVILGVICGISILTRSTFISFMPFLFLWLFLYLRMKYLRHIVIAAVAILLVVTPWFIRNYLHLGYITLGGRGGMGMWTGNNPYTNPLLKANLGPDYLIHWEGYFITGNSSFKDVTPENDKIYYQRTLNFIQNNPKVFVENLVLKLSYLYGWRYFY